MEVRKVVFALASLALSGSALGFTGNEVRNWYVNNPTKGGNLPINYLGYVAGVVDTMQDIAFCAPKTATYVQLGSVARKYIEANPEQWDKNGSGLIMVALSEAYPCK